jgi:hypothetical protein
MYFLCDNTKQAGEERTYNAQKVMQFAKVLDSKL